MEKDLTPDYISELAKAGTSKKEIEIFEQTLNIQYATPDISILDATFIFYTLIYLSEKKDKKVLSFMTLYNHKFVQALYDYCIGVVTGELRHAIDCLPIPKISFNIDFLNLHLSRNATISKAINLNPESIINIGIKLFDKEGWPSTIGGHSWFDICNVLKKYGTISNIRWIDEIIHCRHCGGRFFDRNIIFKNEDSEYYKFLNNEVGELNFRDFLNYRQSGELENELDAVAYDFTKLLNNHQNTITQIINYKPINYGFTDLTYKEETIEKIFNFPIKTQKQINSKTYISFQIEYSNLHSIKLYVSNKFSAQAYTECCAILLDQSIKGNILPKNIRIYFLYTYLSHGKQYYRKSFITSKAPHFGLAKKFKNKLVLKVLKNTNNANSIKIYIDCL